MAVLPVTLNADVRNDSIATLGNCQEYSVGAGVRSVIVQSLGAAGKFVVNGTGTDGAAIGAAKFLTLPANTPIRIPVRSGPNFALASTATAQGFEILATDVP